MNIDGENCHCSGWYSHAFFREFDPANIEADILFVCEILQTLIIIYKYERGILNITVGNLYLMKFAESIVMGIFLAKLAKRSLILVGLYRKIAVICSNSLL